MYNPDGPWPRRRIRPSSLRPFEAPALTRLSGCGRVDEPAVKAGAGSGFAAPQVTPSVGGSHRQRGGQRGLPARGHGPRPALGQLGGAELRLVLVDAGLDRRRQSWTRPRPAALGQRRRRWRCSSWWSASRSPGRSPSGELRDRRNVAAPALGALGGLMVPIAHLPGREPLRPGGARLGHRHVDRHRLRARHPRAVRPALPRPAAAVPADARPIVDDIGAITVMALFYTDDLRTWTRSSSPALLLAVLVGLRWARCLAADARMSSSGIALWLAVHRLRRPPDPGRSARRPARCPRNRCTVSQLERTREYGRALRREPVRRAGPTGRAGRIRDRAGGRAAAAHRCTRGRPTSWCRCSVWPTPGYAWTARRCAHAAALAGHPRDHVAPGAGQHHRHHRRAPAGPEDRARHPAGRVRCSRT